MTCRLIALSSYKMIPRGKSYAVQWKQRKQAQMLMYVTNTKYTMVVKFDNKNTTWSLAHYL